MFSVGLGSTAVVFAAASCCLLSSAAVLARTHAPWLATSEPAVVMSTRDGVLAAAVERAVMGARRRLAHAECAAVLADFVDANGRTLAEAAAALGPAAPDALSRIRFRDGRESVTCSATSVAAFTGAGSRVVFVCPQTFLGLRGTRPALVIIHELLHSLGLGERPPSSAHIDHAVARRCDR